MQKINAITHAAGMLYPTLEALTDDIYASEFTSNRPTDHEVKFGDIAPLVQDMDLKWLIDTSRERDPHAVIHTDPKVRTHLYLGAVANYFRQELGDTPGARASIDRHYLDTIFPNGEHIGTPLSYTDINVQLHNSGGYVLTYLGGGHAGNRMPTSSISGNMPLFHKIEGMLAVTPNYNSTCRLPLHALLKAIGEASEIADLDPDGDIRSSLLNMQVPSTQADRDNISYVVRFPGKALPTSHISESDKAIVRVSMINLKSRLPKDTVVADFTDEMGYVRQKTSIDNYSADPRGHIDDEGNATYILDTTGHEYNPTMTGVHFSIATRTPVHELKSDTNAKMIEATEFLRAQSL